MRNNSMADLVSKVSTGKGRSDKSKEYAAASEWPKCSHAGCPLMTTIKAETVTCGYHYKEHGISATCTTEAIKEFLPYLKKHNEMVFWDVKQWKEKRPQIMGWPVLPASEKEMDFPTMYISRLKTWIDKGIVAKSIELYNAHA